MSRTAVIGSHEYATESAWGEANSTFGTRTAILDNVDLSGFTQEAIDPARVTQYRGERTMKIRGVQQGQFSTRYWLAGHGSTTAGATSASTLGTLLGNVIGTVAVAASSGDTANGAGADGDTITTTGSGLNTPGAIIPIGALNDGDGEGQWYGVASHTTTTLELSVGMAAAVANGAVIYSAENIYPDPDSAATLTSTRHRLMTANQQVDAHGCFPTSINYTTGLGQPPAVTINWQASRWAFAAATQPTTASVDEFNPAAMSAGSLFLQNFGTTTRATYSIRSVSITHNLDIVPLMGPGGVGADQIIVGAVRGGNEMITMDLTVDAQTSSATPTLPGLWDSDSQYYHAMLSFNGAATGKKVGLYFRKCYLSGPKIQQINEGGINRWRFQLTACVNTAGTNDITRTPYVLGLA